MQQRHAAETEPWLDPLDQHTAEDVRPGVVGRDPDPGRTRAGRQPLRVGPAGGQRRQKIDSGKAFERFRHRQPVGLRERIGALAAKGELFGAGCFRRGRHQGGAIRHHRRIGLLGAIPLDQGEFRMVQSAPLAIAVHAGELEYPAFAGGEQLLAGEFRRRPQIQPRTARRRMRPARWQKRADASRCRAKSVAPPSPPPRNRAPRTIAATPPRHARAPQERTAVGMHVGRPPGGRSYHGLGSRE